MKLLKKINNFEGFSLIEILVVISIAAIIFTVIVFNQSYYQEQSLLSNSAEGLAGEINQAQVYGNSVRTADPNTNNFTLPYGINIDISNAANNNIYSFFSDKNENRIIDNGEKIEQVTLPKGFFITSLCRVKKNGVDVCNKDNVDITFQRPSLESHIVIFKNNVADSPAFVDGVRIIMESPHGFQKTVSVYTTGNIEVK